MTDDANGEDPTPAPAPAQRQRRRAGRKRRNGDGTVYRDGAYWVAAVTIPGSGGRRVKRRARTQPEAWRRLRELLRQIGRGELAPPGRLTLGAWARTWAQERALGLRASAAHTLEQCLRPLWQPAAAVAPAWQPLCRLGGVRLHQLTAAAVAATLTALLQTGAGARRVQLLHGHLTACLDAAARRGLVGANPLRDLPRPRAPARERPEWTAAQARRFLAAATDPARGGRYAAAPFLAFLLLSGMRVSEGLGVTWADVALPTGPDGDGAPTGPGGLGGAGAAGEGDAGGDLALGQVQVWVRRAVVWGGTTAYRVEAPKTKSGARVVALPPLAARLLRERWAALSPDRRHPAARVWTRADGTPWTPQRLAKTMRALCDLAGVPRVNVHHLRHTFTALALAGGADVAALSRVLGHAKPSTTLDVYSYALHAHQVAGAVDAALTRRQGGQDG